MSALVQATMLAPPIHAALAGREFSAGVERGLSALLRLGLGAVAVLVLGFGVLIAFLPMAGAVIAPGEVSVETHVKEISHPFGGVAKAILVEDGDHVHKGQALIRLDARVAGAAAQYIGLDLDQLLAKEARLRALRNNAANIAFPDELRSRSEKPQVATILADERRSFELERAARGDQRLQLARRIAQAQAEVAAQSSRAAAYARQSDLVHEELSQTRQLYAERLTTLDRLNALERAAVGVEADNAAARSGMAEARARIAELRAQMASIESVARSQAALELAQVGSAIAQVRKEQVAASDQNDRSVIRAPQTGIVDKLAVRTLGSVVPAGQTLLEIVPEQDRLVVKARIRPTDIDQVAQDRVAHLRFTALSMRTTPELEGKVVQLAADRTIDRATNTAFYPATIAIPAAELRKLGKTRLAVGMPVEVFVQTGERTMLHYILRPLGDQLRRALRE
ncbi:HlyD family type I secretion periplasmic adaptor subunit [Novosphingobium sp. KN65.2]|uniref:HlyD family type I secretion periplasmic adaptor subunit n=1 Tax=Novosphingobium sp. KN65.2 TaxID=1478134 RepID=UPI0005E01E2B|nr:HlyD family type I secretion periplasmic adaptor subunit [Novosphingobium sp. KN65.2]CDO37116.1 Rhizobiocin secretion protein; RspE [Novosphingobium sp. KN65.2]